MANVAHATLERTIPGRARERAAAGAGLGARFAGAVRRLWSRRPPRAAEDEAPLDLTLDMIEPAAVEPGTTEADHTLLQWLWGPGELTPCGPDLALGLVKDLGLTSKSSLLELEPGLGGSTRAIAREIGAWITAFASDPDVAARAAELSAQSGFAKKAAVQPLDLAEPGFKKASFDHALAAHGLTDIALLDALLKALKPALKPKGRLVLAQFVADPALADDDALIAIGPARVAPAGLRTADALGHALGKAGFSIVETRPSGPAMRTLVVQAWARLAERLRNDDIDARYGAMVLAECKRWVRIDGLMDEGALDHVTILAERT